MKKKFFLSLVFLLLLASRSNSQKTKAPDSSKSSISESNLEAQTKNQLAQADYYTRQTKSENTTWIPVLGVLVAGMISFGASMCLSYVTLRNERKKAKKLHEEEHRKATRIMAARLIRLTAQGYHSLTWILWIAKNTPTLFDIKHVHEHDMAMNKLYAEIAGAQIMLSAYNRALYEKTEPLVHQLYKYDGKVGRIAPGLHNKKTKMTSVGELGNLWKEIYDFSLNIPKEFSRHMESEVG